VYFFRPPFWVFELERFNHIYVVVVAKEILVFGNRFKFGLNYRNLLLSLDDLLYAFFTPLVNDVFLRFFTYLDWIPDQVGYP